MASGGSGAVLVLDTCGERASVALFRADELACEVVLPERTASATLLGAVREALESGGVRLSDLSGIGVVNGPGSFTGVRIGVAMAKGLCEAAGLPVAAVSRLAVLADAAGLNEGLAVLRAGPDYVYVREMVLGQPAREFMTGNAELLSLAKGRAIIFAEESLLPAMQGLEGARLLQLSARLALPLVRQGLDRGETDLTLLDANYVRDERAIYRRQQAGA